MLSDIDGMYTDDPHLNPDAKLIPLVPYLDEAFLKMGKATSSSNVGTGGMSAKLVAAQIATSAGADMIITNGHDVEQLLAILRGDEIGTLFLAHKNPNFDLMDCLAD